MFFLGNIGKENVFYDILERKNAFLGYKNKKLKKVEKWTFFQRGEPMVFVQKWRFFQLFFSRNIEQENVFDDILERKNTFLGYKKKKFKEIDIFPKGLTHGFDQKTAIFLPFFYAI